MVSIIVHPRISERHPEIGEEDVRSAWENMIAFLPRLEAEPTRYIAVGTDLRGRLIEMVAQKVAIDQWVVFHAMTPPSRKTLVELKITRR